MVALLVLFTILVFLTLDYALTRRTRGQEDASTVAAGVAAPEVARYQRIPAGASVHPGHLWILPQPSGLVRVGPDPILLAMLGGVESIYPLPDGTEIRSGGPLVMLRRGNRALKIRSPIEGRIARINEGVRETPGWLHDAPAEDAWIYELEPASPRRSLRRALDGDRARSWLRDEAVRLRDAVLGAAARSEDGHVVMADGGLPMSTLDEQIDVGLDDRQWERLVAEFFRADRTAGGDRG